MLRSITLFFFLWVLPSCANHSRSSATRWGSEISSEPKSARFFSYKSAESDSTSKNRDSYDGDAATSTLKLTWPVSGRISSLFGPRGWRNHEGLDIAAPRHTPIKAAKSGRVSFVGNIKGYGKTVIIQHAGFSTLYAHCHKLKSRPNQLVREGQVIATVGATGRAHGAHLHFEIRDSQYQALDPLPRLRRDQFLSAL